MKRIVILTFVALLFCLSDYTNAVAPITPSISISKDSKYLYVILNGILYQIDAKVLKIEKRIKITP